MRAFFMSYPHSLRTLCESIRRTDYGKWNPAKYRLLAGFFFLYFNDGVPMDILEAKKNLKKLHEDKEKIESLNHLNAPIAFKFECDKRLRQIDGNIETIKQNIKRYGR